ncbi:AAA family ATPase [Roseibium litorale]|uniref:AAA family ATPase n=1 Tax=Roseibium litorale TaxID=2803841 RepID=A0ABR9CPW2_9HYPH|nr:AAA family ATPase [Roseibium litorale]MBD8892881.1 AAA family ATPase [Roseibium litorale]
MCADREEAILNEVLGFYLESGDFNGLGVFLMTSAADVAVIRELVSDGSLDLVRGDAHPNPHIKAFPADSVELQLEKIDALGLAGCLYPTPQLLKERNAGANEAAPYTRALKEGAPQLSYRAFDLRALEWYRNDPRFDFDVDDIHGRILQKEGTQVAERAVVLDGLEFFEFGFAYDEEMHRALAAFIRYLHDLPEAQQIEMQKHELPGLYKLHPDFFRTQIIGDFPERMSIYDAFLQEKVEINRMCELMGKPKLFRTEYVDLKRPRGFGILIRPTKKEFRDFALLLDQLLSDDLNREFFKGDLELNRNLTDEDGNRVTQSKGTIQLLEEWIGSKLRPAEPAAMAELFDNLRAVRKVRQKPAHIVEDNEFDQNYVAEQRELITKAYDAVRTLRMVLENHPATRGHEVPDYLREAKVWTM